MHDWTPDIALDEPRLRELVAPDAPEYADLPMRVVARGWDNVVVHLGDLYFRFPVRQIAFDGVRCEVAALPVIAAELGSLAPGIEHVGTSEHPWFAYRPCVGREARPHRPLPKPFAVAEALGGALAKLHSESVAERLAGALPDDRFGRADVDRRMPRARESAANLPENLGADRFLDQVQCTKFGTYAQSVVHGDLHFRHVLVADDGLSGIIDWGDLHFGTSAVDYACAFMLFDEPQRDVFWNAYGRRPSRGELMLARFVAFYICDALWRSASDFDDDIGAGALEGLKRVIDSSS